MLGLAIGLTRCPLLLTARAASGSAAPIVPFPPAVNPPNSSIAFDGTMKPEFGKFEMIGPQYTLPSQLGRQEGGNLFHSFSRFGLLAGESATFLGPNTVQNILARVTGGQASGIDGLLKSNIPGANLFLMNPHGILFGPNASLDVDGAFVATTASSIQFADEKRLDASVSSPLDLTFAAPEKFGFLGPAAEIQVTGNSLDKVRDVRLIGGNLSVKSVGRNGIPGQSPHGEILLSAAPGPGDGAEALVGMKGEVFSPGNLRVARGKVAVEDSRLESVKETVIRGGHVVVEGSEITGPKLSIEATGDLLLGIGSFVNGSVKTDAPRDVERRMDLQAAGKLSLDGATIDVSAQKGTQAGARQLSLSAQEIVVSGGTQILADNFGTGEGANVTISGGQIELKGTGTVIQARANSEGAEGANVLLQAKEGLLSVSDGAQVSVDSVSVLATGGGTLRLEGKTVTIAGPTKAEEGTLLARARDKGQGGDIWVVADETISISGGAKLSVAARGGGIAGSIHLAAPRSIDLTGADTAIISEAERGNAGSISVHSTAGGISIKSQLSVQSQAGHAGSLTVAAAGPLVAEQASLSAKGAEGGNIELASGERMTLRGVSISASAETGDGGNIRIHRSKTGAGSADPVWYLVSDSNLSATSSAGKGGEIFVDPGPNGYWFEDVHSTFDATGQRSAGTITKPFQRVVVLVQLPLEGEYLESASLWETALPWSSFDVGGYTPLGYVTPMFAHPPCRLISARQLDPGRWSR